MPDGTQIFNALEAVWWAALAILVACLGHRTRGFTRGRQIALAFFLAAFGVSDAIEVFTGVWWRPPALLVLKGFCLTGLIVTAALIYAARWRSSSGLSAVAGGRLERRHEPGGP